MYSDIFEEIKKYDKIVIARHIGVDPDAWASQVALRDSIKATFPNKQVYAVGNSSSKFNYFPKLDRMPSELDGLLIVVDTPDKKRVDLPDFSNFSTMIKIDHHPYIETYCDIEHIDDVVIKYLNELTEIKYLDDEKQFSTERKLKIGGVQETISVKAKLTDFAICAISNDGKKELLDVNSKRRIEQAKFASTMDKVLYCDCNAKTFTSEPQDFDGKEKNWTTAGIAPSDCHRLLYRTNNGKINVISNEGSEIFTGVKLKNDENIVQMEPLYRGSKLIVKSTTNKVKVINSNEYDSCRKNSYGKSSKTGFKNIQTLTVCHKGCKVLTRDNKILEPEEITKSTKILGTVGDKNFVILENGKRLYATIDELSKLERIRYVVPLKFSGRKPLNKD